MNPIRVLIVDDHPLMRQALEMAIEAALDMRVVGEAPNGEEALRLTPNLEPDVILMDLMMPKMGGFKAIQNLASSHPETRVLVLSSLDKEDAIIRAVQSGAWGYVTKDTHRDELLQAIRTVHSGESFMPLRISSKLLNTLRNTGSKDGKNSRSVEQLTKRQKQVLDLLGQGLSSQQISEALHIADSTVRVHISHIMDIFGFENRRELVVYAVRQRAEA